MNKIKLWWTVLIVLLEVPFGYFIEVIANILRPVKKLILKYLKLFTGLVISISSFFIYGYIIPYYDCKYKADSFIEANYPALECTSTLKDYKGPPRYYKANSYEIGNTWFNGWNVWYKGGECNYKTAFHVDKCEITK